MASQPDDAAEAPAEESPEADGAAQPGAGWPAGYVPPASPAYSTTPVRPGPRYVRARPAPAPPLVASPAPAPPASGGVGSAGAPPRRAGRPGRLLVAGMALTVAALAAVAAVGAVSRGDGGTGVDAFGTVREATGGAAVRAGDEDAPMSEGDDIGAGAVAHVPAGGSMAIDVTGGGVVRLDAGARLAVLDDAGGRDAAGAGRRAALEVRAGRVWINPPDGVPLEVRLAGGTATTVGNPLAVECDGACSVEAPAGGVEVAGEGGGSARPVAGEVVRLRPDAALTLGDGTEVTGWARRNLDADAADGLPAPEPADDPGVRASAVLDGTYPFRLDVVTGPDGDALPAALVYSAGETYDLRLGAEGAACPPSSCEVAVTAAEATGTARVSGGTIEVTFEQRIDCYDESYTNVVVRGIGSTTVSATLAVAGVDDEGDRWRITSFSGPGTIATTLTKTCNPGDVLGTSTSTTDITGG